MLRANSRLWYYMARFYLTLLIMLYNNIIPHYFCELLIIYNKLRQLYSFTECCVEKYIPGIKDTKTKRIVEHENAFIQIEQARVSYNLLNSHPEIYRKL